jgi:hypothetical protein
MQMHGHDFSECKTKDLSLQLNHLFEKDCKELYSVGKARGGLDVGGPFWADISELRMSAAPIHQIVGHNKTETPMHHELERGSFRMADCLTHCNQFWVYQPMELSWSKEIIALGK